MKTPLFLVLDGNALLHRAWHSIPPLTTQDGTVVNAVYGFTVILEKLLTQYNPKYMAVAWDLPGGTFRHEAFEDYKAQRVTKEPELYDQIPMLQEMLEAYGVTSVSVPGFEGDDVIGTLSHSCGEKDITCLIVTGDHDTMQLVNDKVSVLIFIKGVSQTKTYTPAEVEDRFGVTPAQMIDYKVLVGDPSDNIKGFPGIGAKTASSILQTYGDLDNVVAHAKNDDIEKKYKKHFADAEQKIKELRNLVAIRTDVEGIDCDLDLYAMQPNHAELYKQFVKLEFRTLAQKYKEAPTAEVAMTSSEALIAVSGVEALQPKDDLYYFLAHADAFFVSDGTRFTEVSAKELNTLLAKPISLVGHDIKYALHQLHPKKIQAQFFDVMLEAYIIESHTRDFSLGALAQQYLEREDLGELPATRLEAIIALHTLFETRISEDELERIATLEHESLPILYSMEVYGIKVDTKALDKLSQTAKTEIAKLEERIHELAGREFNIQSPAQLADILFEDLALPTKGIKKTKSGYSTRASELEKLWDAHPIIELISQYREIAKLKSTYIDVFPQLVDKESRVHTTYHQTGTVTGRLSSSDPNLQNIPIRSELGNMIRSAFVAEKGYALVAIDYSQIELRLVADMSGDEEFIEAFKKGADIHTFTAARVFEKSEADVTADERRHAKAINFGILYGMGARSLAKATGVSQLEAKQFIDRYFVLHKGIAKYMEDTKASAHEVGYVKTAWGRRRYLPELSSGIHMLVASGERMAINAPIQGTKADVVKQSMIDVEKWIRGGEYDIRMLLQVHDELVFEVPVAEVAVIVPELKRVMEQVWQERVPLVVNAKVGPNWGTMEELL